MGPEKASSTSTPPISSDAPAAAGAPGMGAMPERLVDVVVGGPGAAAGQPGAAGRAVRVTEMLAKWPAKRAGAVAGSAFRRAAERYGLSDPELDEIEREELGACILDCIRAYSPVDAELSPAGALGVTLTVIVGGRLLGDLFKPKPAGEGDDEEAPKND